LTLDEKYFKTILSNKGVLVDVKGMYRGKMKGLTYWSL
jgi:UDP-N-acetyl-D-galactosamine dehydrogenase